MEQPIVIIGSGFAAYQLVKAIRRQNQQLPITVITADEGHDYNKPDLSHVFSKRQKVQDLITQPSQIFAEQHQVNLFPFHQVTQIDVENNQVVANEKVFPYSKLVLATGANVFIPPMQGDATNDVVTLNSLAEFASCHSKMSEAERVLVLGGGLIGVEVALDLANAGKQVVLVEPAEQLMANLLPATVAHQLTKTLSKHCIEVITTEFVEAISREEHGICAQLSNGSLVRVDQVLVCAGLRANTQLAKLAGLEVNYGICVDDNMQTSAENVYALGDCAEFRGEIRAFLQPTLISANALAKTLCGQVTAVTLPNMMVKVKTPNYPIQLGGITHDARVARWLLDIHDSGIVAKALDEEEKLIGFVVTDQQVNQAFPLFRQL